jgi:hypothetical protein
MAHFAATGPRGKKCSECLHRGRATKNGDWRCDKYRALMGKPGPKIWGDPLACKYFEQGKKKQ